MPEAIEIGRRPIIFSKQPLKPETVISIAETRKAPIASGIETPAALVISIAAPGVDQAVSTGTRKRNERAMLVSPMPRPSGTHPRSDLGRHSRAASGRPGKRSPPNW
jgi:hypothetical protein